MTRARGFTLLEVMIALAILAVGMVALSDLNGGAVRMHAYARRATEATLLLRGKMLDVEDDLHKNGFSDFDDEKHGTFEGDDVPAGYAWSAEILKPDIQLDPAQLLSMLGVGGDKSGSSSGSSSSGGGGIAAAATALAGAMGGSSTALQGLQTGGAQSMLGGPLGGMLTGQATTFIETLKKSVRQVRLTVSWGKGGPDERVTASQIIVILPESVGKDPQAAQSGPQFQSGPGTGTGTGTGASIGNGARGGGPLGMGK